MKFKNNEHFGIFFEKLLCEKFNINFQNTRNLNYNIPSIVKHQLMIADYNIPHLKSHEGHLNNGIDFKMFNGATLSVKTNFNGFKVCPQNIGQTTKKKILNYFKCATLDHYKYLVTSFDNDLLLNYLNNLFCCDYLLYLNLKKNNENVFTFKKIDKITLNIEKFTKKLTRTKDEWTNSTTMKIHGKPFAEFQIHSSRNSVSVRFDMRTIIDFIKCGIIKGILITYNMKLVNEDPLLTQKSFNYIGSKKKLLPFLKNTIEEYCNKPIKDISSFLDLFSGTGVVTQMVINNGCNFIVSNDLQYYAYILSSVLTNKNIDYDKISTIINDLNIIADNVYSLSTNCENFIHDHYSLNEFCHRMYLTQENALIIDHARKYLNSIQGNLTLEEFNFLIKIILLETTKVSNIATVYGAYLKKYKESSLKKINFDYSLLNNLIIHHDSLFTYSYNMDALECLQSFKKHFDVIYLDPPYNTRNYNSNFHLLETIALYDNPDIKGITGLRKIENTASKKFCSKINCYLNFKKLIEAISCNFIFISYSSDGLLSIDQFKELLCDKFTNIQIKEQKCKKLKTNTYQDDVSITEFLICARKI